MANDMDQYARRAFDFIDAANGVRTSREAAHLLKAEMAAFGFEFLTVWSMPAPGAPLDGLLLNTRPQSYVDHYVAAERVADDPVVTHLRYTLRTYSWSDVRATRKLSKDQLTIIDEGRDFGAKDGLTIPIVTDAGTIAVVSPCGANPDLSNRSRAAVTMIAIYGHQCLMRLAMSERPQDSHQSLSAREREVLQFVAIGKTDSEIAEILGLSTHTVLAHVERAKRKLGTPKRAVAVIEAIKRREITI